MSKPDSLSNEELLKLAEECLETFLPSDLQDSKTTALIALAASQLVIARNSEKHTHNYQLVDHTVSGYGREHDRASFACSCGSRKTITGHKDDQ